MALDDKQLRMMILGQAMMSLGGQFSGRQAPNVMGSLMPLLQMRQQQDQAAQLKANLNRLLGGGGGGVSRNAPPQPVQVAGTGTGLGGAPTSLVGGLGRGQTPQAPSLPTGGFQPGVLPQQPGTPNFSSPEQKRRFRLALGLDDLEGAQDILLEKPTTPKLMEVWNREEGRLELALESDVRANPRIYAPTEAKPGNEKAAFGGGERSKAIQKFHEITQKQARGEPLTKSDQFWLNVSRQIATSPKTLQTPEGVYTYPGVALPGGQPQQAPAFSPKNITGEQAMRVSMLSEASSDLDALLQDLQSDGELNRTLATELRTGVYASSKARIHGPNLERTREAFLRALTGAAAPDQEVERVKNLMTPSVWDIATGDYKAVENKLREAQQIFNKYVTIAAPGRDLVSESPATSQEVDYIYDQATGKLVPQ